MRRKPVMWTWHIPPFAPGIFQDRPLSQIFLYRHMKRQTRGKCRKELLVFCPTNSSETVGARFSSSCFALLPLPHYFASLYWRLNGLHYFINDVKVCLELFKISWQVASISKMSISFYFSISAHPSSKQFNCWSWSWYFLCTYTRFLCVVYGSTFIRAWAFFF